MFARYVQERRKRAFQVVCRVCEGREARLEEGIGVEQAVGLIVAGARQSVAGEAYAALEAVTRVSLLVVDERSKQLAASALS